MMTAAPSAVSSIIDINAMMSAVPFSLPNRVCSLVMARSPREVQVARGHVERHDVVGNVPLPADAVTLGCAVQREPTAQRRVRHLHAEGDTDFADPEQVGVE